MRVYIGRGADGKRIYQNKTVRGTKKDAERVCNDLLSRRDLGALMKPAKTTLEAHLKDWMERVVKPRVKARTYDDYERIAMREIGPALGGKLVTQISPSDIQGFYLQLGKRGLSARSIRYVHAVLSNALKIAVRWQLIPSNPCDHVDLPKAVRKTMTALSPEEAKAFLSVAANDPLEAFFLLQVTAGFRPNETLALRWSDIDFASGIIRIERALSGRAGKQTSEEPKTSKSRRQVPVPTFVIEALRKRKEQQDSNAQNVDAFGLVFRNSEGRPLDLNNITKRHYKPLLAKAGINRNVRLYDLRHTCATLLLRAGESPKVVAERLGHSSIVLTLDTYSHLLPDMQRQASEKLEKMLS